MWACFADIAVGPTAACRRTKLEVLSNEGHDPLTLTAVGCKLVLQEVGTVKAAVKSQQKQLLFEAGINRVEKRQRSEDNAARPK